jgi:uncharacterized protein (TIGR02145 family)
MKSKEITILNEESLREIEKYEAKLISLREIIVELEIEINDKVNNVVVFEAELNAKFGVINQKLKKLELQILEYEKRIELLKKENEKPEEVEKNIKFSFTDEKRKLNDLEDEYKKTSEHFKDVLKEEEELPKLTPAKEAELKKLFKILSLKHHPNKGGDASVFIKINEAYKKKDFEQLNNIDENCLTPVEYEGLSLADKLTRIIKQCIETEKIIDDRKLEIAKILNDQTYLLMIQCKEKRETDILKNIYAEMEEAIDLKTSQLNSLITEYNTIINKNISNVDKNFQIIKRENESLEKVDKRPILLVNDITNLVSSSTLLIPQYKSVKIGDQIWMVENLNVDHYRNGDAIPEVKEFVVWKYLRFGAWCKNSDDPENGKKYGKFYNWYAVNDPRGLAPQGWHIPTMVEFETLVKVVNDEANALKAVGQGTGTNTSGFSALLAGDRITNTQFPDLRDKTFLWSSSESGAHEACYFYLYYFGNDIRLYASAKEDGFSIRCLKDK